MNRRDFLKTASVAAGCAAGLPVAAEAIEPIHDLWVSSQGPETITLPDTYARQDHVHKVKIIDVGVFAPGMLITIGGASCFPNGTYRVCSVETDGATCEIV